MCDTNTIHVFEAAALGVAPFKLDHVTAEGGNCEFCGTPIVFRFYLQDKNGSIFFVGSDCVMKTGDKGLMKKVEAEVKKRQKELRDKREDAKLVALKSFLADPVNIAKLSAEPHPYNWYAKQGKTRKDFIDFTMKHGGKTAKLKIAKSLLPDTKRGTTQPAV